MRSGVRAAVWGLVAMAWAAPAAAQERLSDAAAVEALCRYAPPRPAADDDLPAWTEARVTRLLTPYLTETSAPLRLGDYDPMTQRLTAWLPPRLEDAAAGYTLELGGEGPVALEVAATREEAEALQRAVSQGPLRLRLRFALGALGDFDAPLCARSAEVARWSLRGRLLGVSAWSPGGSRWEVLPLPAADAWSRRFGLGASDRGARPRVWVREAKLPGVTPPAETSSLARDLERLLLPCFLDALGSGGPSAAALTLEAWMEGGQVRSAALGVDATGSPALTRCALAQARLLRWSAASGTLRARFVAYFDQQP